MGALGTAVGALGVIAAVAFGGFGALMLAAGAAITGFAIMAEKATSRLPGLERPGRRGQEDFTDIAKPFDEVINEMIRTVRAALPQIAAPLKEAFATIARRQDRHSTGGHFPDRAGEWFPRHH